MTTTHQIHRKTLANKENILADNQNSKDFDHDNINSNHPAAEKLSNVKIKNQMNITTTPSDDQSLFESFSLQLSVLQQSSKQWIQQLQTKETRFQQLNNEINQLKSHVLRVQQERDAYKSRSKSMQAKQKEQEKKFQKLQNGLLEHEKCEAQHRDEVNKLNKTIDELCSKNSKLNQTNATIKADTQILFQKLILLADAYETLQIQHEDKVNNLSELHQKIIDDYEQRHSDLQQTNKSQQTALQQKSRALEELKQHNSALQVQLTNDQQRLQKIESESKNYQNLYAVTSQKKDKLENELNEVKKHFEQAQSQIERYVDTAAKIELMAQEMRNEPP